jgi:hypothetical protein
MFQIFRAYYGTRLGGEAWGQEAAERPKRRWYDNTKPDTTMKITNKIHYID